MSQEKILEKFYQKGEDGRLDARKIIPCEERKRRSNPVSPSFLGVGVTYIKSLLEGDRFHESL